MCLIASSKQTDRLRRRIAKTKSKRIRVFKVVMRDSYRYGGRLYSSVFCYVWKPGWNRSSRRGGTKSHRSVIYRGIHVFIRKSDAMNYFRTGPRHVLLPVDAELDDLVAASGEDYIPEAVFTKVFVRQADYEAAIAQRE